MSTPRFVRIAFTFLVVCAAQVMLAQNGSEHKANEQPSRYKLRDISKSGSPLHVPGTVTFRDNPAVVLRYFYGVEALVKNVSDKDVLSWAVRFETSGGRASGLNFSYWHDYFLTGDALAAGAVESVHPSPSRFGAATVNGAPITHATDSSTQATTASVRVEFVQYRDGSTWGDGDVETEVFRERRQTLHKLESLQRLYSERGEKAFLDALAEPTTLPCIERVKKDCQNNNDDSSCALGTIQKMVASAAQYGFQEKP